MEIIKVDSKDLEFEPITIQLTIESKEELANIESLCERNIHVPRVVKEYTNNTNVNFNTIQSFLDKLLQAIKS